MIPGDRLPDCEGTSDEVGESHYLETREGSFLAIKGFEHPPNRWIGVLRYVFDAGHGDRQKGGKLYRRLYRFAEQEQWIRAAFPEYLAFDPVFQTTLQSVPRSLVQRIYDPCLRLRDLVQACPEKGIEADAAAFAGFLQKETGVPQSCLGITGSLLIGLHTELSDLDIAVFGAPRCRAVHRALLRLLDSQSGKELSRLDAPGVQELYAQRITDTPMAFHEFVNLEKRKTNQGRFRNRMYFIRFIKGAGEAGLSYGQHRYTPLGRMRIAASIAGDQDAIFTPCRYLLSGARNLEGSPLPDLREIVSFRGRFCEQARTGEAVVAAGTLERVQSKSGDTWHRLLLGNSTEDTLLVRQSV